MKWDCQMWDRELLLSRTEKKNLHSAQDGLFRSLPRSMTASVVTTVVWHSRFYSACTYCLFLYLILLTSEVFFLWIPLVGVDSELSARNLWSLLAGGDEDWKSCAKHYHLWFRGMSVLGFEWSTNSIPGRCSHVNFEDGFIPKQPEPSSKPGSILFWPSSYRVYRRFAYSSIPFVH